MFQSNNSRRDFLKASASLAFLPGAYANDAGVIRVGVIGCGGRGEAAAMNAMNADKGIRISAMADIRLDRIQEVRASLKQKYPGQVDAPDDRLFTGFDAYRHVIDASDVVIIANAAKFHAFHLLAAIEAGRHAFVEKPHAIDPHGLRLLRAACEKARAKRLCVVSGLQSRYHPGYQETIQRVQEGAIGEISTIQETWLRPPYVLRERLSGQSEVEHQASNQYHFHWLSGDDVPQTLVHNLDRSRWVLGDQRPLRCYGMGGRSTLHAEKYGDVYDHHAVVYDFPGYVRVYAYCRTIDNCYDENSSVITGTKGKCDLLRLSIHGATNWKSSLPPSKNNAYDLEHVALFKAIRSGNVINNANYMIDTMQTVIMGQIACYTGKVVEWDQVSQSDFCYAPRPEECRADMEPPVKPGPDGIYPVAFIPGESKIV
jgi:myo-inositol 2-dehydrogenase / D-chiro-inositol 1-dehydrogenase